MPSITPNPDPRPHSPALQPHQCCYVLALIHRQQGLQKLGSPASAPPWLAAIARNQFLPMQADFCMLHAGQLRLGLEGISGFGRVAVLAQECWHHGASALLQQPSSPLHLVFCAVVGWQEATLPNLKNRCFALSFATPCAGGWLPSPSCAVICLAQGMQQWERVGEKACD